MANSDAMKLRREKIVNYVQSIVNDSMHAKRILSLCNAVESVMCASSLALSVLGKSLAMAQNLNAKHAVKQLDRFFSNKKVLLDGFFSAWIPFLIGSKKEIIVALDWTEFDKDKQSTLSLNLITKHGRSTAMAWKTYDKSRMAGRRNAFEDKMIYILKNYIPDGCKVTILADRGFSDTAFFRYMAQLGFNYIIRIKSNISMRVGDKIQPVKNWLSLTGRAKIFKNVYLTKNEAAVPAVVCVHDKKMAFPWFLVTNISSAFASKITKLYGRRFTIEENFRDIKDIRFGMGLSYVQVRNPERRDRILIASAIASSLLIILGAAGESLGFDRLLKVNTVKKRTHSLLSQGAFYFHAMVNYKDDKLTSIINKFTELISEQKVFKELFWVV